LNAPPSGAVIANNGAPSTKIDLSAFSKATIGAVGVTRMDFDWPPS
jgi:hypothetical protein